MADVAERRGLVSVQEAAVLLGVSLATVQRQIRLGRLTRIKLPRIRCGYVRKSGIRHLLATNSGRGS